MRGVSWDQANAYCGWSNRRLPTEAEWEKSARGVDGRIFPWGNHFDWSFVKGGDSRPDPTPMPEPVGTFAKDESPYGVHDMSGSLQEWCGDWYDAKQNWRALRSSSFAIPSPMLFRISTRLGGVPEGYSAGRGFRLVKLPAR